MHKALLNRADGSRPHHADGTSVIENINQIDRGYEDIDGRLRSLGARIKRI